LTFPAFSSHPKPIVFICELSLSSIFLFLLYFLFFALFFPLVTFWWWLFLMEKEEEQCDGFPLMEEEGIIAVEISDSEEDDDDDEVLDSSAFQCVSSESLDPSLRAHIGISEGGVPSFECKDTKKSDEHPFPLFKFKRRSKQTSDYVDFSASQLYAVAFHPFLDIFATAGVVNGIATMTVYEACSDGSLQVLQVYQEGEEDPRAQHEDDATSPKKKASYGHAFHGRRTSQDKPTPNDDDEGWPEEYYCVSLNSKSHVCVGGRGRVLKVIDCRTQSLAYICKGHSGYISECAFSHKEDDLLFSSSQDWTIRVWKSGELLRILAGDTCHQFDVLSIALHPSEDRVLSSSMDGTVREWDWKSGKMIGIAEGIHGGYVDSIAYLGDSLIVSRASKSPMDMGNKIQVWRFQEHALSGSQKTPELLWTIQCPIVTIWFVRMGAHGGKGLVASTHENGDVYLVDVKHGPHAHGKEAKRLLHIPFSRDFVPSVMRQAAFNHDGTYENDAIKN
jgi:WD40 repeat protein